MDAHLTRLSRDRNVGARTYPVGKSQEPGMGLLESCVVSQFFVGRAKLQPPQDR
jgi:hypothetical protein